MLRNGTKTWKKRRFSKSQRKTQGNSELVLEYDAETKSPLKQRSRAENRQLYFCRLYATTTGFSSKSTAKARTIFDREKTQQKPPSQRFQKRAAGVSIDCIAKSWSFNPTLAGTYTGGTIKYTDPYTEKDVTFKLGSGSRLLNLNTKADNEADAERQLKAAINNANHEAFKMSIVTMGNPSLVSGQTVNISGWGQADGKYYINQVVHGLGNGGYQSAYSLSKVTESF